MAGSSTIASGTTSSMRFDNQTKPSRGRLVRYLMRSREISVGRAAKDHIVDADLYLVRPANIPATSDHYAQVNGRVHLANEERFCGG